MGILCYRLRVKLLKWVEECVQNQFLLRVKFTAECAAKDEKRVLCVSFFCEGVGSVEDLG